MLKFFTVMVLIFVFLRENTFAFKIHRSALNFKTTKLYSSPAGNTNDVSAKKNTNVYTVEVPLGEGYQSITCQFRPIFQKSMFFSKTYGIPFGLNIEKPPKNFPAPFVTKDSPAEDGEKKGDILRATTCWSQGFNAAGATSDIMMFAGNVKWRRSVFDTTGAPWQQVVDALLSNTAERSQTVTLVFERELEDDESSDSEPPAQN